MSPDSETLFAKRLVARLGREPEVAPNVQARLAQARARALASKAPERSSQRLQHVLALPWRQAFLPLALASLVLVVVVAGEHAMSELSPVDGRAEQAFIDYHVGAESGLASLLRD